jgi:mRNA-degrading endonuclease RelE of RelBE toxin-antitoxin system
MKIIRWHKNAKKHLRRIKNAKVENKIYDAVQELKFFPQCKNVKKLVGRDDYRLRVGDYRVIFTVDLIIVSIEEVKKRDEHTY